MIKPLRFLDSLAGALARALIVFPLIGFLSLMTGLIFIDTLRERGFNRTALTQLLFAPFISLLAFVSAFAITLSSGFHLGLINQMLTMPFGLTYMTHPSHAFFSQGNPEYRILLDWFSATGVGFICTYCMMLLLPMESYLANLNFIDSVHNQRNTAQSSDRLAALTLRYGSILANQQQGINISIQQLLQRRIVQATARSLEKRYAEAALRCYQRLQSEVGLDNAGHVVSLRVAQMVWMAIEHELPAGSEQQARAQEGFASYLSRIQRGYNINMNPNDDGYGMDLPECPRGAREILLSLLSRIPNPAYSHIPVRTTQDNVDTLRGQLRNQLNSRFQTSATTAGEPLSRARFIQYERPQLADYALSTWSLFANTEDRMSGLSELEVQATLDAVCDEWMDEGNQP